MCLMRWLWFVYTTEWNGKKGSKEPEAAILTGFRCME